MVKHMKLGETKHSIGSLPSDLLKHYTILNTTTKFMVNNFDQSHSLPKEEMMSG